MTPTLTSLLIVSFVFFCLFIVTSILNYKKRFKLEYHLRNTFPYELNWHLKLKENIYGNTCFLLYLISSVAFLVIFNINHSNNGFLIASFISCVVAIISQIILIYVPLEKIRIHMVAISCMFVASITCPCTIIGAAYKFYDSTQKILYLIILIIAAIIAVIVFILILNPKLSHWGDMDKKVNDDGTISPIRPKFFVLAYTEWILFFLLFISQLLMLLILL